MTIKELRAIYIEYLNEFLYENVEEREHIRAFEEGGERLPRKVKFIKALSFVVKKHCWVYTWEGFYKEAIATWFVEKNL